MMSTLAEAKAALVHVQAQQEAHKLDCPCRHTVRGRPRPKCEERDALAAETRRLRGEIKTWFAPQPGDATLFDEEG
jgi:hypothetical protein